MTRLAIVAGPAAASIGGLDGPLADGGEARTLGPGDPELGTFAPEVTVLLGVYGEAGAPAAVRWLSRTPRATAAERVIAPGGDQLWRRAPWPVRDELFSLAAGSSLLVVASEEGSRAALQSELERRNVPFELAGELDRDGLARASAVLIDGEPGGALPGEAMAVLAAGRVLLAPRAERSLGLIPGSDHLAYDGAVQAAQWAAATLAAESGLAQMRALARRVAEPWRASRAYARLVADLAREGSVERNDPA